MKIIKAIIAIASALAVVVTMVMPAVGAIVTTHPKNAAIPMVVITDATGDKVSLASLPAPFNTLLGVDQGPGIFAFTWTYERKQYGYAYFDVDVNGNATVTFEFSNSKQIDGDTFTATAVLLDKDGNALDQIIGRAGVNAGFGSTKVGYSTTSFSRPVEYWNSVTDIVFFFSRVDTRPDEQIVAGALQAIDLFFKSGRNLPS